MEWLSLALRGCLQANATKFVSRMTPEGRSASRALMAWKVFREEKLERKERAQKVLAVVSPAGRAMAKGLRGWRTFAVERKQRMSTIKNALARLTPEGRAMNVGLQGFKSRTPTWRRSASPCCCSRASPS